MNVEASADGHLAILRVVLLRGNLYCNRLRQRWRRRNCTNLTRISAGLCHNFYLLRSNCLRDASQQLDGCASRSERASNVALNSLDTKAVLSSWLVAIWKRRLKSLRGLPRVSSGVCIAFILISVYFISSHRPDRPLETILVLIGSLC